MEQEVPQCSLTFIGTATTLLRLGGFTLLTDPNFVHRGQWVHIGEGIVSRRRTEPAVGIDELPDLDGVVLSHLHGDHFDRVARRGLHRDLPVFTTPQAARSLRRKGFTESVPMSTWAERSMTKAGESLTLTSLPGTHAYGVLGKLLPPVMGTLIEYRSAPGRPSLRIYLSGDTLVHEDLRRVARRWPDIDYAVVHLGGTRVAGILLTMDGGQGVDLLEMMEPRHAIPVHYDDYGRFKSPLSDFRVEVDRRKPAAEICYVHRGQTRILTT
jgi:L-ascorbate metabolism protein UlaG (beta-lactamase superfamily)